MGKIGAIIKASRSDFNSVGNLFLEYANKIGLLNWMNDSMFLKFCYRVKFGRALNLSNPKAYTEKLQWLKLYDRKPEYTTMVDKYEVKKYVSERIGEKYIIPTLGVWNSPDKIVWDSLPDKFVLKCTHDSGTVIIVKDKSKLDKVATIKKLNKWLKRDFFMIGREWPYKNVQHRIIAEEFIPSDSSRKDLPDYKFFCFDGKVKGLFIATDRHTPGEDVKFDFYDENFNHLPFLQGHAHAKLTPIKPCHFEEMKQAAEKLAKGLSQVRVDFYDVGDRVLFGEITLFHMSGFQPFIPEEWDFRIGKMLNLPDHKTI